MEYDQDIKGFTILELLVVITIVAIISGIAYPNFSTWKKDREVRYVAEKITGMITNISTQTQRGTFTYSQFSVVGIKGRSSLFFSKGMKDDTFNDKYLVAGKSPDCKIVSQGHWDDISGSSSKIDGITYEDYYEVFDPEGGLDEKKVGVHFIMSSAICFGKGGDYYKATEALSKTSNARLTLDGRSTPNYIIICSYDQAEKNAGICPNKPGKLKKPAYLVKWSRFGNVTKYKWNEKNSIWTRQ